MFEAIAIFSWKGGLPPPSSSAYSNYFCEGKQFRLRPTASFSRQAKFFSTLNTGPWNDRGSGSRSHRLDSQLSALWQLKLGLIQAISTFLSQLDLLRTDISCIWGRGVYQVYIFLWLVCWKISHIVPQLQGSSACTCIVGHLLAFSRFFHYQS